MVRSAIVDAVVLGCIPVFFHPAQLTIWPLHWNASNASVHFNWAQSTIGDVNNITLVLEHARRAIHKLLTMADEQVSVLQHELLRVASRLTYRGQHAAVDSAAPPRLDDAVDVLLRHVLPLDAYPRGRKRSLIMSTAPEFTP